MSTTEIILKKLSHKIRTPLANINMAISNVKNIMNSKDSTIDEQQLCNTLMDNIKLNAEWCNWYITLLDVGAREISQENFPLSQCSMGPILSEALEKYLKVNKAQIEVSNKADSFDFIGNKRLMRQIFFHLLDNAVFSIKHAKKGEILISSWEKNDFNYIEFKDTGMGIPEEYLDKIYDSSFSTKNGLGNGLFFSKKAMLHIGGEITCTSKDRQYTSFILKCPKIT